MKYLNNFKSFLFAAVVGMFLLTACEGSDIYNLTSPDWLSEMGGEEEETDEPLVGMMDDVYTIGATDYSTGWWAQFSKYYVIPEATKWNAQFNLHINPNAPNTFKNFAMIITNDVDRGGAGYVEYGAIRFDHQPSGNSEWGDHIDRSLVESNLTFETDTDEGVTKLGGVVTLTVDRREGGLIVKITNGTVTKTYTQTTELANLNADQSNTNIRVFVVPEGSYIDWISTNIEPIGGCTSKEDKQPTKLELANVPETVSIGTTIEEAFAGVTGTVTFDGLPSPVSVTAKDLIFESIPDFDTEGEKTLIAMYNKTYKGANADKPVVATAKFLMVAAIQSIEVTKAFGTQYFYTSAATSKVTTRPLNFDALEVTATYEGNKKAVVKNSELTFSRTTVPATAGKYDITITTKNGKTATTQVEVKASTPTPFTPNPSSIGTEECNTSWAGTDQFAVAPGATIQSTFINYSNLVSNWNNWLIELHDGTTPITLRADNYGWSNEAGDVRYKACTTSGGQSDWATWLAAMNGARCTSYITNCGNGYVDVQVIMNGINNQTYYQYYLNIPVNSITNLKANFNIDGSHLVFE